MIIFLKLYNKTNEIIKISTKNRICLTSSYKFTLNNAKSNIIVETVIINEPNIKTLFLFW